MAKLLNLLAISSLAIVACSFGPAQVNALSTENHNVVANHAARGHGAVAKRKRAQKSKRCKVRSTSLSATPAPTPTPKADEAAAAAPAAPSSSKAAEPKPAAAPAPAPEPAPVYDSPPVSGSGRKLGLAWPNGNDISIAPFAGPHTGWSYSWSPWLAQNAAKNNINAVPMLWGEKHAADFDKLVKKGYATHAMGMNEPNEHTQGNISPEYGAELWIKHIQPLKALGYTLVSPACTNGDSGREWMKNFFIACKGCTIDRIAVHYYGTNAQGLIDYVEEFANTYKKPVWLTEFACQSFGGGPQCDKGQVFDFASKVKAHMENSPSVEAYFPFGFMHDMYNVNPLNQLMKGDGTPTELGYLYMS